MSTYHHHICATGALHICSIGSISASLARATLADSPDASISYSFGIPSSATTLLRFRPHFFPSSPPSTCVVAFGRPRFALPAAFLAASCLARSARIASRSSYLITRPSPFFPGFFRISDFVFQRVLASLLAALRSPM
jgi:hypothetical protein